MKYRLILVAILLFGSNVVSAQQSGEVAADTDRVEQGRAMIREGRAELIRQELQLTDVEAAGFWPVYEAYRAKSDSVMDRYTSMLKGYLRRYDEGNLSDEYADELIATFFGIKRDLLDVQEAYLEQFRSVLPGLKVARFFQLENKTNAEIDAQLALAVPLIDPT